MLSMPKKKRVGLISSVAALVMLAALLPGRSPARAWQDQSTALRLLESVTGEISAAQPEQRWTFYAIKGQRLAVRVQATSGDLDPYVELLSPAGKALATSQTGSYRNAIIENFETPAAATYTVRATRAQASQPTSGSYTLTLLPGFSFLLLNDPSGARAPMRVWREPNAMSQIAEGRLHLQLLADSSYTWTTAERLGSFKDLYYQVDMQPEPITRYWEGGLLFRGTRRNNAAVFYVFLVNSDGKYRLAVSQPGGLTAIQDWKALPSTAQRTVVLGLMAKGNQFTLFYNGQALAVLTDDTLSDPGSIGVAIGTGRSPNNSTSILFTNFIVTLPGAEGLSMPVTIPPQLTQWQRTAVPIIEELQAARLVPSIGKPGIDVGDAFVTNNTANGIILQPLAKSLSFTDLVYTADVIWESNNDNIACGMEFRSIDDTNFTIVYIDRKGGYGILQRSGQDGDIVSLYNLSEVINKENRGINRVTIIAIGNGLIVYINGTLITNVNVKQSSGFTFIAAYNYDRASSICQFKNVWLRSFDR
jgi:hypothetical protein